MHFYLKKLDPSDLDVELVFSLTFLYCCLAFLFYRAWPEIFPGVPACPFKHLVGIPCLTCGVSRCALRLAELRVWEAFKFNPLGAAVMIIGGLFTGYGLLVKAFGLPRLRVDLDAEAARDVRNTALLAVMLNWAYLVGAGV